MGGGPAGSSAALRVLQHGAGATIYEKSRFPRHKVCGEFLSTEIAALLESLGVGGEFAAASPATIRRLVLRFRSREKRCLLPEAAYGMSRYKFDHVLFDAARKRGATVVNGLGGYAPGAVMAHGRKAIAPRGRRLFGFKAHFEGPCDDAVELYFFNGCYVGINTVENGITNVCGLGPEHVLRAHNFEIDGLLRDFPPLRARLDPLCRKMDWLMAGPLVFETHFDAPLEAYPAGDALSFIDPFTGSGILTALLTGSLAGRAAAQGTTVEAYLRECRERVARPFAISSAFRLAVAGGWGEYMAPFVPGKWLLRLTRPATLSR